MRRTTWVCLMTAVDNVHHRRAVTGPPAHFVSPPKVRCAKPDYWNRLLLNEVRRLPPARS